MEWLVLIVFIMAAVALFIYISKDHEQDNQDDRKQSKESNHNDRKHPTFADNDIHIQVAYDRDIRNVNKAKERGRMEIPTILGLVPLALGRGAGSEMERPLALTVMGGLATATFLTLFVIPIIYELMDEIGHRLSRKGVH